MSSFPTMLSTLALCVSATTYECNFVDMGFGIMQPANQCVIGKAAPNQEHMSMEHICIDPYSVESRLYTNSNCEGAKYEVLHTFSCEEDDSFVKCQCHHDATQQCPTITDYRYVKRDDGSCDKTQATEFRKHVVMDSDDLPQPMQLENQCFERVSHCERDEQSMVTMAMKTVSSFSERIKDRLQWLKF